MKISCASCNTSFSIPDEKLPMGKKVAFPCPSCKEKIRLDLRADSGRSDTATPNIPKAPPPPAEKGEKALESGALRDRILKTLKDLPAMPQVVVKAREIMGDANSGIKDVVKVLETDQAITAKILRVSNSAYYGMSGKISTIQHASVVLGYKTIGELITLAASSGLLNKNLGGYGLGSGDLWRHSLSVAIGSRVIAEKNNPDLSGPSFSAGLIHDAGKLVLDKYVAERQEEFDEITEFGQVSFMEAEDKIFGFNHAEIGFDVCHHWRIPEDIATAVKFHHAPSRSEKNTLAYIIHLADAMVNMADALSKMDGMGANLEAMMYMLDDNAMKFVGISETDVAPIMEDIAKGVGEMAGGM